MSHFGQDAIGSVLGNRSTVRMSLRDMVTGSDACTTTEGAGPSNAFAGLANRVLGTSSKDQEQLKEVCQLHLRLITIVLPLCCPSKIEVDPLISTYRSQASRVYQEHKRQDLCRNDQKMLLWL